MSIPKITRLRATAITFVPGSNQGHYTQSERPEAAEKTIPERKKATGPAEPSGKENRAGPTMGSPEKASQPKGRTEKTPAERSPTGCLLDEPIADLMTHPILEPVSPLPACAQRNANATEQTAKPTKGLAASRWAAELVPSSI